MAATAAGGGWAMVAQALWVVDHVAHESMLFAGLGLLIGGIDDLLVDLCFIGGWFARWRTPEPTLATLPPPSEPGRLIVFVPAWDEEAVIGRMLRAALDRYDHHDYAIYVGAYPNDPGTIAAANAIARTDTRVRLVVGHADGPTTKADCLNNLWEALIADEKEAGFRTKAIVLHDAEDVVHPAELRVVDSLIEGRTVIQMPVLPLIAPGSRLVSGHYANEFAEAHGKQLIVRVALGAAMPLAGTGCGIARATLARIAAERGGRPFDAASLTEDYELGLRIAEQPGRALFARVRERDKGPLVAVRAYFPSTLQAAARQKARWMTGIALAGWDRTGWGRVLAIADHWMRMRDRRAPLAVIAVAAAYVATLAWLVRGLLHWASDVPLHANRIEQALIGANASLLVWRLGWRMGCTGRTYGWRESLWSVPRFFVGNVVALMATPRAIRRYVAMLSGAAPVWDKTRHDFPAIDP
ncbi:glycosyl transferase family protein [Sphingomonas sp. Tas61C01]|uniref:glycosyl transferase family protein n=1 Tax=Sphingomonas sp. Tas61C01 TaxID=3458297 RepID=UPI00403E9AC9